MTSAAKPRSNYLRLLESEAARKKAFQLGARPKLLGGATSEHLELRLTALDQLREGKPAEAQATLEKAAAASPRLPKAARSSAR